MDEHIKIAISNNQFIEYLCGIGDNCYYPKTNTAAWYTFDWGRVLTSVYNEYSENSSVKSLLEDSLLEMCDMGDYYLYCTVFYLYTIYSREDSPFGLPPFIIDDDRILQSLSIKLPARLDIMEKGVKLLNKNANGEIIYSVADDIRRWNDGAKKYYGKSFF